MSNENTQEPAADSRRRFLTLATAGVGAVGTGAMLVPFGLSLAPSERARAAGAPVEVDISHIEEGQQITVEWRGKPVWIIKRPKLAMDALAGMSELLADPESKVPQQPEYATNQSRSKDGSDVVVLVGICTHLGCSPTYRPELGAADLGADWQGGFLCACHGSKFDLAGRVFKGVPAPTNLPVPPHKYLSDSVILVGEDA